MGKGIGQRAWGRGQLNSECGMRKLEKKKLRSWEVERMRRWKLKWEVGMF